jgi:hypothetical protein
MRKALIAVSMLYVSGAVLPIVARADALLETANFPVTSTVSGFSVGSLQFVGARFSVSQPTQITDIGGVLKINQTGSPSDGNLQLFGAISALGVNQLPADTPSTFQPLATVTFSPEFIFGQDTLVPLSVLLAPGDYTLIFGSGRFGATGQGFLPFMSGDTPQASYFRGAFPLPGQDHWINPEPPIHDARFVVMGNVVPEPSAITLASFGIGTLFVVAAGHRRRLRSPNSENKLRNSRSG